MAAFEPAPRAPKADADDLIITKAADMVSVAQFPTLQRSIMARTGDHELSLLLMALTLACKATARACNKAGIADLFGLAGEVNATGDDQKKLDVLSNDIFIDALVNSGTCAVLVSEENEEPIFVPKEKAGRFIVSFDPLDGSSNIDCNVSTGTIFAIYDRKTSLDGPASMEDVLRKGSDIKVAGYCMYGAATELVITFQGHGVHRFTLDPSLGEFVHIKAHVKIPEGGGKTIYSCNEGNSQNWDDAMQAIVHKWKLGKKPYSARYVGSMVSDVHRTILYGGVYLYPADKKEPNGKLRVLYEGFPMAMIMEAAGGAASCGMFKGKIQRMLDIVPTSIHEKCPVVIGCQRDVDAVIEEYKMQGLVGA
jgi:fructose-1,6-bisphosphatase I